MKHKITAVRMDTHKGEMRLSGITQSPRGTKTIAGTIKRKIDMSDRKARKQEILSALEELLHSD